MKPRVELGAQTHDALRPAVQPPLVSARGIHPNPEKVQAVQDFPTPSSLSDVRAFVGMASYYRRYVRNFADIAAPVHELTKGGR